VARQIATVIAVVTALLSSRVGKFERSQIAT